MPPRTASDPTANAPRHARPHATPRVAAPALSVCRNVSVVLGHGETLVTALTGVELTVHAGERLVLWGRSGSGKSTLLHVMGGLLAPTSGSVDWDGRPLQALGSTRNGRLRAPGIANVFQSANLLPYFTAFENVSFADLAAQGGTAEAGGASPDGSGGAAVQAPLTPLDLLRLAGLDDKAEALPSELSGGEAQRVAIARSLAQRPRMLLCDEPTGHLDSDTGARVLALIEALQRELGFALVIATHDPDVAARFPREVELLDGRVIRDEVQS
jgi:ABC-type lipoprotein export system ATPase subunit